jgi:hypothetical protein
MTIPRTLEPKAHVHHEQEGAEETGDTALRRILSRPVLFQNSAWLIGCEERRRLVPWLRRWRRVAVSADGARR